MRRPLDAARLRAFMRALGAKADRESRVYLTGGATAVLLGWRESTIDVDLKLEPETDRLLRALASLKETLELNIELAAPDQFIPELAGWRESSPWIAREGQVDFHHYDAYSQALAKDRTRSLAGPRGRRADSPRSSRTSIAFLRSTPRRFGASSRPLRAGSGALGLCERASSPA